MLYLPFILCHDYGTKFCLKEGLQPRSLFGFRVVTRLSNGSQVAYILLSCISLLLSLIVFLNSYGTAVGVCTCSFS
ncbi:hypothetical protein M6B38_342240 [Iris pallida]|uniref:Uncharacterized protein n=1 Tax=Iris pallida TaxID=29817 RepID=A0AAX6GVZ2_IRIPA|nr:hypothetical protein M6B38_342240 [Iris pallida]